MSLRHADPERDGPACAAIYAPYVDGSGVWFEDVARTGEQFAARIEETSAQFPWHRLEGRRLARRVVVAARARPGGADDGDGPPPDPLGPQRL